MNVLEYFSIPYQGLKNGLHTFSFEVDDKFFKEFESSPIKKGDFKVSLELDKKSDMAHAFFNIKGGFEANCDRCLADLMLKVDQDFVLHIKYGEHNGDLAEVMFIEHEALGINFAQYIYESIVLSIPMIKLHETEMECDQEVIEKMNQNVDSSEEKSNIWDSLKGLKLE